MPSAPSTPAPNDSPAKTIETIPFNRELSWIEFNRRVLGEAFDTRHPLLERVKFLSIFFSNLDEFFMTRVGGIKHQIAANVQTRSPDGFTPKEQLRAIGARLEPMLDAARALFLEDLIPRLAEESIFILAYAQLSPPQREWVKDYFVRQVFPVLTPLAFDPSHPFPHISNLSLNLAVVMQDPVEGELFARVKVPEVLPRFVPIPRDLVPEPPPQEGVAPPVRRRYAFVWLEEVIAAHLPALFPGMDVAQAYPFRLTRDADLEIEEDEADDLLRTIEEGVRQRRFGDAVRLQVDKGMPERICQLLASNLDLSPADVDTVRGPQGLADLIALRDLDRPELKDPPVLGNVPAQLRAASDIFQVIRQQDILFHHPYDSIAPVVSFIQAAAEDPGVLAIKQTLYRVGHNSPIVKALMDARERGKQVTVVVELKARFDEQNNIGWARALERAGVHVVYGLVGLKVHAKLALVVRKEHDGIRRYVHLGTGNYNTITARVYTDFGLLTCREDLGADASELFNYLTGYSKKKDYRKLLVAPLTLRTRLLDLIRREVEVQARGGEGRMILKANSLVDAEIIDALYAASRAGVRVDLVIRGMCALRPEVPGMSERIRVRSVVGPFLEHSRIFYFQNGGQEEVYLGSADLMERNLSYRVEAVFPLEDPGLIRQIRDLLDLYLRDNVRAHVLRADGTYERPSPGPDEARIDSQKL